MGGRGVVQLARHDRAKYLAFESNVLATNIADIEQAKLGYRDTNAIIVTDRIDIGAYVSSDEYWDILGKLGWGTPPYLSLADKIVYLPSVAREDPALYRQLRDTNTSRLEADATEAAANCQRTLESISMHPELSLHWGGSFESKMTEAVQEITHPEQEQETKFVYQDVWAPHTRDRRIALGIGDFRKSFLDETELYQSYHSLDDQEFRLRHGVTKQGFHFYHFAMKSYEGGVTHELRRTLTYAQYSLLRSSYMIGDLHKLRHRYIVNLGDKQTVASVDMYDRAPWCVIEVEGIDSIQADKLAIPYFDRSTLKARDLV